MPGAIHKVYGIWLRNKKAKHNEIVKINAVHKEHKEQISLRTLQRRKSRLHSEELIDMNLLNVM